MVMVVVVVVVDEEGDATIPIRERWSRRCPSQRLRRCPWT